MVWPLPSMKGAKGFQEPQCIHASLAQLAWYVAFQSGETNTTGICSIDVHMPMWTWWGYFEFVDRVCVLTKMLEALLNARWACFDDQWTLYVPVSLSLALVALAFLASAFPEACVTRWVLFCHPMMQFLRGERSPLMVANPSSARIPMVFLADGGHIDNTGVYPLLRRQ